MPEVTGVALITELQKKENPVPVIVVSSNIQNSMQKKCQDLGVKGFLNKPPNKDEVVGQGRVWMKLDKFVTRKTDVLVSREYCLNAMQRQ